MKHESQNIVLHLNIAALLLGGTALFSKLIPYNAIDIIGYRSVICGITLLLVSIALRHKMLIRNKSHLVLLIVCSALFTVHWAAYFHSMQLSSVAVGMISMFTFPVITVFLEPIITKTSLQVRDILMGLFVLSGVMLLVPTFSLSDSTTAGVAFGVLSGFAVALRNVLVSKYLRNYSPFTIMTYHSLVTALILLPFSTISVAEIGNESWLLLLLLGTVFTAVPHSQKTYALGFSSAKSVSMIISLQVVYGTLFAYILLSEPLTLNTFVGGSIILFAATYESVIGRKS